MGQLFIKNMPANIYALSIYYVTMRQKDLIFVSENYQNENLILILYVPHIQYSFILGAENAVPKKTQLIDCSV